MKKSLYLLMMFLVLALTGCEPMEDIHEEVDAAIGEPIVQSAVEIELTEDDYTTAIEDGGFGLEHTSFNSIEDARALIPQFLAKQYPVWGKGSLALVTFNLYDPLTIQDHTISAAGYEAIGLEVEYFTNTSQIGDFLSYQFPQAEEGDYVRLTYRTIAEEITYELNDDDFDLIGEKLTEEFPEPAGSAAQYNNFDRREGRSAYWSNEMILKAINVVLSDNFDGVEGQTYEVTYDIYDGSAGTESMHVKFNGNSYVAVGGSAYEFSNDDYDLVGEELGSAYPEPAGNAAQFNSFEIRVDKSTAWTEDMILEALNVVLKERKPSATEGAQFNVTYKTYNGSVSTVIESVILQDGTYVVDETSSVSTIRETAVFAKASGNWGLPLTLEREDYTAMGQSFPNFDDQEEAIYKLETFLELEFPYAEEGDFIPVAYDFYNGSTNTRYANFIFADGEFNYIPSVVEETIQFGHNGTEWEPDNTIEYTLTKADFAVIGEELIEEYPRPAGNAGQYGSFERREGTNNYWSDDMLLEAVTIILNDIAPNPEEGQKYIVRFAVYTGSLGMESISVIYQDGEWVLNE